jgi:hypothetical protein
LKLLTLLFGCLVVWFASFILLSLCHPSLRQYQDFLSFVFIARTTNILVHNGVSSFSSSSSSAAAAQQRLTSCQPLSLYFAPYEQLHLADIVLHLFNRDLQTLFDNIIATGNGNGNDSSSGEALVYLRHVWASMCEHALPLLTLTRRDVSHLLATLHSLWWILFDEPVETLLRRLLADSNTTNNKTKNITKSNSQQQRRVQEQNEEQEAEGEEELEVLCLRGAPRPSSRLPQPVPTTDASVLLDRLHLAVPKPRASAIKAIVEELLRLNVMHVHKDQVKAIQLVVPPEVSTPIASSTTANHRTKRKSTGLSVNLIIFLFIYCHIFIIQLID